MPTPSLFSRSTFSPAPLDPQRRPARATPPARPQISAHPAAPGRGLIDRVVPAGTRSFGAPGALVPSALLPARSLYGRPSHSLVAAFAFRAGGETDAVGGEDRFAAIERGLRLRDALERGPAADSEAITQLLTYYPALEIARRVAAEMPSLGPVCAQFLTQVAVPSAASEALEQRVLRGGGSAESRVSHQPARVAPPGDLQPKTSAEMPTRGRTAPRLRLPEALSRLEPPSAALGLYAFASKADMKECVATLDNRLGILSDAALRELAAQYSAIDLVLQGPSAFGGAVHDSYSGRRLAALFRLLDRALHLQLPGFTDVAGFLQEREVLNRFPWGESGMNEALRPLATLMFRAEVLSARCAAVSALDPVRFFPTSHGPIIAKRSFNEQYQALRGSAAEIGGLEPGAVCWTGTQDLRERNRPPADIILELLAARDPAIFDLSPELLKHLGGTSQLSDISALLDSFPDPRILKLASLASVHNKRRREHRAPLYQFLTKPIPERFATPGWIPFIADAAATVDVPLSVVQLEVPGGTLRLSSHPDLALSTRAPGQVEAQAALIERVLKTSGGDQEAALYELLGLKHVPLRIAPQCSTSELIAAGATLRRRGFAPRFSDVVGPRTDASGASMPPSSFGEDVYGLLRLARNPAAAAILAGLYVADPGTALEPFFAKHPEFAPHAARWTELAERVSRLDEEGVTLAFSELGIDPDFEAVALRLEMCSWLERHPSEPEITDLIRDASLRSAAERRATIRALGLAATLASTPPDVTPALKSALREALAEDPHPEAHEIRQLLDHHGRADPSEPEGWLSGLEGALVPVVKALGVALDGGVEPNVTGLTDLLKKEPAHAEVRLARALGALHQADLERSVPFERLDKCALTYRSQLFPTLDSARVVLGADTVELLGVTLPRNRWNHLDPSGIPDVKEPVWTPSLRNWFPKLARADRDGQPRRLEGPPGTNKTSAVQFLAKAKNQPLVIINVSPSTDETDLVGGPIRGDVEHDAEALVAMSQEQRDELYKYYGVHRQETPDKLEVQVRRLVGAQAQIRFQLSELLRAMQSGEMVLIDEYNLASPAVFENIINPLLDGGPFRLDKNRGEVLERHPDFRIYAAGNPAASTVGRAESSPAARSRLPPIFVPPMTREDAEMILAAEFGSVLPRAERKKLAGAHDALAKLAEAGDLGASGEEIAFTPRDLLKVGRRFANYRGNPHNGLSDADLLRREAEEIYLVGMVDDEDRQKVSDVLKLHIPYSGVDFYKDLKIVETEGRVRILDACVSRVGSPYSPGARARLVQTKRTMLMTYFVLKAFENGENPLLKGGMASGKTSIVDFVGELLGQEVFKTTGARDSDEHDLIYARDASGLVPRNVLRASGQFPNVPGNSFPGIYLLDECNLPRSEEVEKMNGLLDHRRELVLSKYKGLRVKYPQDFRFVAAMNPVEFRGQSYGGRRPLSGPLYNRFTKIFVPPLEEKAELIEIMRAVAPTLKIPEAAAELLVELQDAVLKGYAEGRYGADEEAASLAIFSLRSLRNAAAALAGQLLEAQTLADRDKALGTVIRDFFSASPNAADSARIENDLLPIALRRRSHLSEKPAN